MSPAEFKGKMKMNLPGLFMSNQSVCLSCILNKDLILEHSLTEQNKKRRGIDLPKWARILMMFSFLIVSVTNSEAENVGNKQGF